MTEVLHTVEHVGSERWLCLLLLREKCLSAHELQCVSLKKLFYVYLGLVEDFFNTADLECKREAVIPLFPKGLAQVFLPPCPIQFIILLVPGI